MGFMEESKRDSGRRANGIRGRHQKSEGSAPGGGSLRWLWLGGANDGSTPVPECFILFHGVFHLVAPECSILLQPSVSSRFNRAFHLVSPECFILLHPSVSSRFNRAFHLVAPERFISFQPSVSSCCTRVFHLVATGGLMSGETGTFSPSAPTAGEGRALLPLRHDALDEYVAREQRGGDGEGAIVPEILWGEEA